MVDRRNQASDGSNSRNSWVWRVAGPGTFSLILLSALAWAATGGGFTPDGTQPPLNIPLAPPSNCQACHGDFDFDDNIEPYPTWSGSMMANSTRDPLFWAALDVANNDVPGIGDFCLRCHTPTAWLAGRSEPPGGTVDGCGLIGNLDQSGNDFAGVSCHLCHRMMVNDDPPPGQDPVYFENGSFWIDDVECVEGSGQGPCRRGPYDYQAPGEVPPPHEWEFSQYHIDSDICGNCHNVTSPANNLIDENGVDTGIPFPIERTFKEWQQSDFAPGGGSAQTCQECHMADATAEPSFACMQSQNNRNGNMAVHQFAGGNTWVPAVLRDEYPALGREEAFDATIAWALDMLQNRSADVEVTAGSGAIAGGNLPVQVKVTNITGHKLPTGYPEGRRMWLQVTARDGNNDVIWQSGAYDNATGELTEDSQVKIYETIQGIWNRNGTNQCDNLDGDGDHIFHFVLNNCFVKDNRIPPLGFTGGADIETQPKAYTYPETSPGSGVLVNYDLTDYAVPIPLDITYPVTVDAALLFQATSKEYVEFLRDEAVDNSFPDDCLPRTTGTPTMSRGELLFDMWERYDRAPPVGMGSVTLMAPAPMFADSFESGGIGAWVLSNP